MISNNCSVLIVDDETLPRKLLSERIEKIPNITVAASLSSAEAAKAYLIEHAVDMVLTDVKMPGADGLELAAFIKKQTPWCPVVIISGYSEFEYARKGLQLGIQDYLLKPVQFSQVAEVIEKCRQSVFQRRRARLEQIAKKKSKSALLSYLAKIAEQNSQRENLSQAQLPDSAAVIRVSPQKCVEQHEESLFLACYNTLEDALPGHEIICLRKTQQHYDYLIWSTEEFCRPIDAAREYLNHVLMIPVLLTKIAEPTTISDLAIYFDENVAGDKQKLISIACEYMQTHLSEPLTRSMVARQVFLSPSYFGHLFKQTLGVGYNEYLTNLRMERAKNLLNDNLSVRDVAAAVGYQDAKYFSELFYQKTGYLPSEYRYAILSGQSPKGS